MSTGGTDGFHVRILSEFGGSQDSFMNWRGPYEGAREDLGVSSKYSIWLLKNLGWGPMKVSQGSLEGLGI